MTDSEYEVVAEGVRYPSSRADIHVHLGTYMSPTTYYELMLDGEVAARYRTLTMSYPNGIAAYCLSNKIEEEKA